MRFRPFVLSCVLLTLLAGAANVYLWQEREAAAQEHHKLKEEAETVIRTLTNRPRIEADLAALREAISYIDRDLIDEQSMEVNLGYFYRLEKASRVRLIRLNQLSAPAPSPAAAFKSVPFSMQLSGTYLNNMNFLRALETGACLLRIRNCSFERNPTDGNDLTVELLVEILARK
jgi:hypothetical protein